MLLETFSLQGKILFLVFYFEKKILFSLIWMSNSKQLQIIRTVHMNTLGSGEHFSRKAGDGFLLLLNVETQSK